MKKLKENKGITLIALIITIIVMLILVAVTVNVALNGGLFNKAREAAVKTEVATKEEKEMEISLEIELRREELLQKYPLDFTWNRGSDDYVQLKDLNIIDLYEEILETYYNSSFETLDLKTAIKASDKLYQLYNPKVETIGDGTHGEKFWSKLPDCPTVLVSDEYLDVEEEDINKIYAIAYGCILVKDTDNIENSLTVNKGEKEYIAMPCRTPENAFDIMDLESEFSMIFKGGSLPFEEIENEQEENLFDFDTTVKLEVRKINSNNTNDLVALADKGTITEVEDCIGKFALVYSTDEDKIGFILRNVVLIDKKIGEIYYINDAGVANREIP